MDRRALKAGRLGASWWRRGPLVDEDANCVSHVYWRNGALVDSKGNSWAQSGTVPQVGESGAVPPAAGPFAVANNYTLGSGADVLDFAGGTWSAIVIARMTALPASSGPLFCNATPNATGWLLQMTSAGAGQIVTYNGAGSSLASTATVGAGVIFVLCAGRDGANIWMKLNKNNSQQAVSGFVAPTTDTATIGLLPSLSRVFNGAIFEFYATSTAPSDALFGPIVDLAFSRMKRSAP